MDTKPKSRKTSPQSIAGRLHSALRKYQIDHELQDLRTTYSQHLAKEQFRKGYKVDVEHVIKAFESFNLAPSCSYERYMSVVKNRSDVEALRSDWKVVGEDLSYAAMKHLIESVEQSD